jgi:hypothetical protein
MNRSIVTVIVFVIVVALAGCWTSSRASHSGTLVGSVAVHGGELVYTTCAFEYVAESNHDLTQSMLPTGYDEYLRPQPCGEVRVALGAAP